MNFPRPKLTSRATTDGRIEAVKIEFDFARWREWKEWVKARSGHAKLRDNAESKG